MSRKGQVRTQNLHGFNTEKVENNQTGDTRRRVPKLSWMVSPDGVNAIVDLRKICVLNVGIGSLTAEPDCKAKVFQQQHIR